MSLMRLPRTIPGQFITCFTVFAFLETLTGCGSLPDPTTSTDGYGVVVNTDTSKPLIGGVRQRSGENVYLYGTFNDDGTVKEVQSAIYQNADGKQATLFFDSGRPVRAVGLDGSRLDVTYTEISTQRLTGQVVFTPADGSTPTTVPFDVDLQQAAADLAAMVQQLTGIQISPDAPAQAAAAQKAVPGASTVTRDKVSVQVTLVPVFISFTGFAVVQVMANILKALADTAVRGVAVLVVTPFIIMGNIMRAAAGLPLIDVYAGGPGPGIVVNIPPAP